DRFLMQLGFRYTNHQEQDWFKDHPDEFHLAQYDLNLNLHVYAVPPTKSIVAPYGGVGVQAGLLNIEIAGYDDESDLTILMAADFGLDLKVAEFSKGRSFLTLASINSYDLFGTEDRPKYLTIGGGLRYWFR
ncbi:MAG TPA: hypothetical protein PK112_06570, partial [candidate division Zixibacteria bacterium]|nr:hypothetical protein [candidate division Zixibacteria bacterium]